MHRQALASSSSCHVLIRSGCMVLLPPSYTPVPLSIAPSGLFFPQMHALAAHASTMRRLDVLPRRSRIPCPSCRWPYCNVHVSGKRLGLLRGKRFPLCALRVRHAGTPDTDLRLTGDSQPPIQLPVSCAASPFQVVSWVAVDALNAHHLRTHLSESPNAIATCVPPDGVHRARSAMAL